MIESESGGGWTPIRERDKEAAGKWDKQIIYLVRQRVGT